MCGFAGIINNNNLDNNRTIRIITESLKHRGPDNEGYYIDSNISLGFRRLSIIDLSRNANQPFLDITKNYVIVFNGECYNYLELKEYLIKKGFNFKSNSDTEVVLYLYILLGEKCLDEMNGMYAFAIYNLEKQEIFLARDRAGVKPLYYYHKSNHFLFSSESRALYYYPQIGMNVNKEGLLDYLNFGYTISPNHIFENFYKLSPGHFLKVKNFVNPIISNYKYWKVDFCTSIDSDFSSYYSKFDTLFDDSINLNLRSDVPVGVFLSGGLDSSAVTLNSSKNSNNSVNVFTLGFKEEDYSEINQAQELSELYNLKHKTFILNYDSLSKYLDIIDFLDEPFSDSSIIPSHIISKLISESGYKVALSGDGGDELFGGYYNYNQIRKYENWCKLPEIIQKIIGINKYPQELRNLSKSKVSLFLLTRVLDVNILKNFFKKDYLESFYYKSYFEKYIENRNYLEDKDIFSVFQELDFSERLCDGYLTKMDKASMYNSLEVRVPFLDYRIVELMQKAKFELKINRFQNKVLLRKYLKNRIPDKQLLQKKKGFSLPMPLWIKSILLETIKLEFKNHSINIFDYEFINNFLKEVEKKNNWKNSELVWRIYILAKWMRKYNINI